MIRSFRTLSLETTKKIFLYILYTFFGFGMAKLYIPMSMIYLGFTLKDYIKLKVKKTFFIFLILNLVFIFMSYLIGSNNMKIDNPYYSLSLLMISAILITFISYKERDNILSLIVFYALGMFVLSIIVIAYSYFEDPIRYGYGKLLDPFNMVEVNSPGYSNNLAVVFIVFLYYYFLNKNIFSKLVSISIIVVSLLGALFLAGRTFFFITGLFLLFFLFTIFSRKNMMLLIATVIIISFSVMYFYEDIESSMAFTIERLSEGSKSNRFRHWEDALPKILTHPMGGFHINQMIENTSWLHNLWLDTARTSGWIPLIALLSSNIFILYLLIKSLKKDKDFFILLLMVFMSLLIMFQDVVLEGNWRILMFYYIVVSALLGKITNKNQNKTLYEGKKCRSKMKKL